MKKTFRLETFVLIAILLLAAFFRLYHLDSVPPSPSVDEVSTGYNAYSLLLTGRGEHGSRYPLILQSFDDWQPAMYAYLTIPFIYAFGLSIVPVRLPSVVLSVLSVYVTYLLVKALFPNTHKKHYEWYALSAAFLLAISPWHIYLSRLGYPANAGLSFFIFAVYFLVRTRFIYAMLFFVLSAMSYHTEKVFLPIVLGGFFVIYRKEIWMNRKKALVLSLTGLLLMLPFIYQSFAPGALARFNATSVFYIREEDMAKDLHMDLAAARSQSLINRVMYDNQMLALQYAFRGYLTHFQPSWLVTNTTAGQHKAPNVGLLYPWEVVTIVVGMITFINEKIDRKKKLFVLVWILAAPLASALSVNAPHAVRAIVFLPLWQLFSGIGLVTIFVYLSTVMPRVIPVTIYAGIFTLTLVIFFNQYFIVFPRTQSASFQYALSQAMPFILSQQDKYDKIVFANSGPLYQSYIYYLFYSKYDPLKYHKEGGTGKAGFSEEHTIGNVAFRQIQWDKEEKRKRIMYVTSIDDVRDNNGLIKIFSDLDGTPKIRVINTPL